LVILIVCEHKNCKINSNRINMLGWHNVVYKLSFFEVKPLKAGKKSLNS